MKTKTINKLLALFSISMLAFLFMAFTMPGDDEGAPWEIPSKYVKMKNPYSGDAELSKVGKMLYSKHCKSCHGNQGLGDGPKAKQLKTHPGDFSTDDFQANSDGELYFKSIIGRDEMPNYEKIIPEEEDRWAIINHLRTL
jgi:mono/diheme cytochrome c family protein